MIVGFSRMPCWVTVGHPENSRRFHTNWSALPVFISLPGAKCVAHKLSFFQQKRLSTCIAFHEFDASICIYIHVHMTLSSLHIFFLVKRVTLTQELINSLTHTLHLAHTSTKSCMYTHTLQRQFTHVHAHSVYITVCLWCVCTCVFTCSCVQIGSQIHINTSVVHAHTVINIFQTKSDSLTNHICEATNLLGDALLMK